MSQIYNVLIIGAGKIGAFFDSPESDNILSHAHAFTKHAGFNLAGFVDTDLDKAGKAAYIWGGRAFENIKEAFEKETIDLAVVAVPDELHYSCLKELSGYPVKVIFAEKPITKSISEAEDILKTFKGKEIGIVVNYTRRFVPEFERIRDNIQKGSYGEYLTGTGYYGKGLLHSGSHLIDLLMFFIGDIKETKLVSSLEDFYADDKSIAAVLSFDNGKKFFLQHVDCRNFTMFEMDIFFEKKRIRIYDLGFKVEEYDVLESSVFSGYRNIVKTSDYDTSFREAMYNAAENIYKNISEGQRFKCTAEDGYKALKLSMAIKESINEA